MPSALLWDGLVIFAHNPEPLEKNLGGIMNELQKGGYDMGIVVDPDVDRLAFICEDGKMFGEEYTLVSVADYVLSKTPGNTVSNLSSTRALRDVTEKHGGKYTAAAVGEVNVTTKMKDVHAVIGGGSSSQTDVQHIVAHTHEGSTNHILYHLARDARITAYNDGITL
jgi:phosphomannomutase